MEACNSVVLPSIVQSMQSKDALSYLVVLICVYDCICVLCMHARNETGMHLRLFSW